MNVTIPVFMSWGRWVAKCPRPGCHSAEQFGKCDDGTVGGLTGTSYTCRQSHNGCGVQCGVEWPPNVEDIEYLTRARPVAARNWFPGETVHDLLAENVSNHLVPKYDMDVLDGKLTILKEIEWPRDHPAQDAEMF